MAMKKTEMEAHRGAYRRLMRKAYSAEKQGMFRDAVKHAFEAWVHVDGMMQYERKYENHDFSSIDALEIVLRYAPFLLDYESLNELERLLTETKRIEKNTSVCLNDKLAKAKEMLVKNHELWGFLKQNPQSPQDQLSRLLGGEQEEWRNTAESWEKMGLLRRERNNQSYRLTLITRLDEIVYAKCSACGKTAEAPKAMFFEETKCPECGQNVNFVILEANLS